MYFELIYNKNDINLDNFDIRRPWCCSKAKTCSYKDWSCKTAQFAITAVIYEDFDRCECYQKAVRHNTSQLLPPVTTIMRVKGTSHLSPKTYKSKILLMFDIIMERTSTGKSF